MNDWFEAEQRGERAQQLTESQRWVEALAEIEAALAINPQNARWQANRGYLLEQLDQVEEAVEAYESALELEPGDPDIAVALGAALTRLGRFARALAVFEDVAKTYPDYEPAYCHRIEAYAELGRHDRAEEMFYLAQQLDDECPSCFFHIGDSLAARGQTERAVFCWERVLELDPDYVGVNRRIAQALRSQGRLDQAREYLLREIRDDPGDTDLLCELASLALESGQVAVATAKYAQILELEPEHVEARFSLGELWLMRGRPGRALKCFEAVEKALDDRTEVPGLARRMGEALSQLGRLAEAREHLVRAVGQEDAYSKTLMLLGNCLLASKKPAEAANWFRKAIAIDADNPFAHHSLGICLFQTDRHALGVGHCLEALRHKPDFVVAMYNAAVASVHLGRWREARALLRRALQQDSANASVRELANKLWWYRLRGYVGRLARLLRLAR
ncbi:MAG: tetratricopeptide repeat protein [Planctomycetes bacterium]|nr:tetratricopeptide repeat protein [Planctomycetota bacterium]